MSLAALPVRERLAALPARGLRAADEIAREAITDADVLRQLVAALDDERAVVQARASNALKKVQQRAPQALDPYAPKLLKTAAACTVLEARWNLTLVVGGLRLGEAERALAAELMFEALASPSAFLRAFGLQGLADLSLGDATLEARAQTLLTRALEDRSAAVRARARKLLQAGRNRKA